MLEVKDVCIFVDQNIHTFHSAKIEKLKKLQLRELLKRKNPYLFKAKNINTAEGFVRSILDAYLSSQEETMFGNFLEKLAIFVNRKQYGGNKSPAEGIDLDFSKNGTRYLVSIKSGPNWGNSDQIKKMKNNFTQAKRIVGQQVVCVNGCCYGKNKTENKGDYIKKCGQSFWEFITDRTEFYKEIVEPIGIKAKERNEEFHNEYCIVINRFTEEFIKNFCDDGQLDWEKIVEYNSSKDKQIRYKKIERF